MTIDIDALLALRFKLIHPTVPPAKAIVVGASNTDAEHVNGSNNILKGERI
jgi:hypothetical protein